jgi:menaquinone-dependent protoporphyrinogen IX oxidase
MSKIAIIYLSQAGSTKEVAERIADVLKPLHEVSLHALVPAMDLGDYDVVIVGAPINGMQWKLEATNFIKDHGEQLQSKKVALFALGLMAYQGRKFFQTKDQTSLNQVSQEVKAIDKAIFGGVSSSPLPTPMRILFGISKDAPNDQRNWDHIEDWAKGLAVKIER